MEDDHENNYIISMLIAAVLIVGCLFTPALAGEPGWRDVPQRLKQEDGAEYQGEFLYTTGMALVENSLRADKAHEMARKKSLLRALQLIHMISSCQELLTDLKLEERRQFVRLFAPQAPSIRVKGVTVIQQWAKDRAHFTAVAVPLSALEGLPCEYPDLLTAISRYSEFDQVSPAGLEFCLRHAQRYSLLSRTIKERAGRFYQKCDLKVLARCFLHKQDTDEGSSSLETFVLQNRLARAAQITGQAETLATQGKWEMALNLASKALDLVPSYSRTYLLLADYFLHELKMPTLALFAAEKALRDGTCLQMGLNTIVSCFEELDSPETEVFNFLFSQCQPRKKSSYPISWQPELDRLTDASIPYLIILSAGCAIEGESELPGEDFVRAATLFKKAKSDDDVRRALVLLLQACEKQPLSAKTYNLIGASYRHIGQPSVALPFLWQALKLEPEYDYALTNLGLCCSSLGLGKSERYYFEHDAVKSSTSKWVQESYARFYEADK